MITLAADVRPAKTARTFITPAVSEAARPATANDNTRCWTDDRRARLLLASMAARPPCGEWKRARYVQTQDEWFGYVSYRVEALNAIRNEHGDRAHAAYHAIGTGAQAAFDAWCCQPNVTQAIDAVLGSC